jgi:hypothetical protein
MRGTGAIAELLRNRFKIACKRLNLNSGSREIPQHTRLFQPPIVESSQLSLGGFERGAPSSYEYCNRQESDRRDETARHVRGVKARKLASKKKDA